MKLVQTFKSCVEGVREEKEAARRLNMQKANLRVSKEDLNGADKRRILENFVENDNALSLLLDFISSKHLQNPGSSQGQASMSGASSGYVGSSSPGIAQHSMRSGNFGSQIYNRQQSLESQMNGYSQALNSNSVI